MSKKRKWGILASIVVLIVLGFLFFGQDKNQKNQGNYVLGKVVRGTIATVIDATGTINPIKYVDVSTTVSGTLKEVRVHENQYVQAGDVIAVIDSRNVQANAENARAVLQNAEANFKRYEELYQQGAVSAQMYDNALLTLQQAQATYRIASSNLVDTNIIAPMSGTVIGEPLKVGQTITQGLANQMIIATIADLRELEIYLTIDETDIGGIAIGQKVTFTVDSQTGKTFEGAISGISKGKKGTLGTMSNSVVYYTVKVKISPEDSEFLLPSMTARALIHGKEAKDTLLVPLTAIRSDRSGDYVNVMENGEFIRKYVKVGITGEGNVQILDGLNEGHEIIVSGNIGESSDKKKQRLRRI